MMIKNPCNTCMKSDVCSEKIGLSIYISNMNSLHEGAMGIVNAPFGVTVTCKHFRKEEPVLRGFPSDGWEKV